MKWWFTTNLVASAPTAILYQIVRAIIRLVFGDNDDEIVNSGHRGGNARGNSCLIIVILFVFLRFYSFARKNCITVKLVLDREVKKNHSLIYVI